MGQKVVHLLADKPGYDITGILTTKTDVNPSEYNLSDDVNVFNSLDAIEGDYDVWIDFTQPNVVFDNVKYAIEHHISPIVGTSGLSEDQKHELISLADGENVNGLIAANFGLSAVLLMQFAQQAAKYFSDVEVIEMHHEDKTDSPSGTAIHTVDMMSETKQVENINQEDEPARGMYYKGVPVHAVRLPGYVAHEQVLFGGPGEALTIRQDSFDRESFMQGVWVALEKLPELHGLVDGLENIL
ncbi:4-hydroxy-tetrahydrodipicolinate reductase [Apilactobacillus kunkeei]|nr:4-hydroxy-tetrahydrodipicolinate reductase [Apilactobacillus kunkeei]CAI2648805.1 4-hydroxy-tetrahydrodipicolinate reductase [Apilactobacillus kunkeei]CAI2691203.1 4-hydroxy-tetrahydrodipicolinate reductase [Apilactobacillus kunkeei]CAI2692818.1 4-hydroxy-tetrahydrodipicolinate reductase [Apilactobacillus kunkeei]